MKRKITFDARIRNGDGAILIRVATILGEYQLIPESLVSSCPPGSGVAKFWVLLKAADANWASLLADRLRDMPEVSHVTQLPVHSLGETIVLGASSLREPQQALD